MAFFDFGSLASSMNNFVFGSSTKEATYNAELEPAILDDILGFNFDAKTEMMDLFNNPSVSSSDDFLDKLITELDKEQSQQEKKCTMPSPSSSNMDSDFLPGRFDEGLQNKSHYTNALWHNGNSSDNYLYHNVTSDTGGSPSVTFSQSDCLTIVGGDNDLQYQGQDLFYETSLPYLAETVEVECSHEHSYATNQQQQVGQNKRSFVSRNAACVSPCSSSSTTTLNRPTRNSSVSQSSDSTNNDPSSNHNNADTRLAPTFGGKSGGKGQRYTAAGQKYKDVRKVNNFVDDCVDDDDDDDDDREDDSDIYSVCSPDNVIYGNNNNNHSGSNYFGNKNCNKRYPGRQQYILPFSQSDSHRRDEKYPFLVLSDEERLLCEKEGVKLPVKFPLTKQEERELRRIRRKIRNKRSAQESRRKKHEYITALEDRIKACDKNNMSLRRQVEVLSRNNKTLEEQLKKLQSAVNNGTAKPAVQAGTCLAVLLLSFALLVAPNYDPLGKKGNKLNGSQFGKNGKGKENLDDTTRSMTGKLAIATKNRISLSPGNTRTLKADDDFETLTNNNGDASPSSLSSFFDGSTNWSSSSPRSANDGSGFSQLVASQELFDPSILDDGGGGTFNWTPNEGARNKIFDDWSSFTDNKSRHIKTEFKEEWPIDALNNFAIEEPLIKRAKRCIESDTKPLIYHYADEKYASGPVINFDMVPNFDSAQKKMQSNGTMNIELLVNRRTVKAEEF